MLRPRLVVLRSRATSVRDLANNEEKQDGVVFID